MSLAGAGGHKARPYTIMRKTNNALHRACTMARGGLRRSRENLVETSLRSEKHERFSEL